MQKWHILSLVCLFSFPIESALGQVVQLPGAGSFNLSTTVAVPDSGSSSLGSSGYGRMGTASRGPMATGAARGATAGGGQASMHATVIDLTELDSMIRSQTGKVPAQPKLQASAPQAHVHIRTAPRGRVHRPEYDYLAALSRNGLVVENQDHDAVAYYLGMAERARNRGNWSSVELYYRLAWQHLPLARREAALRDLATARTSRKDHGNESHPSSKPQ
ncbi:MAG: hypothetical protein ACK553_13105 [Planctomycetota bacterium]